MPTWSRTQTASTPSTRSQQQTATRSSRTRCSVCEDITDDYCPDCHILVCSLCQAQHAATHNTASQSTRARQYRDLDDEWYTDHWSSQWDSGWSSSNGWQSGTSWNGWPDDDDDPDDDWEPDDEQDDDGWWKEADWASVQSWSSLVGPKAGVKWRGGAPPAPPQWKYDKKDVRAFYKWSVDLMFGREELRPTCQIVRPHCSFSSP